MAKKDNRPAKKALTEETDFVEIVTATPPEDEGFENSEVSFYCKKCEELVAVERKGKGLSFFCKKCKNKGVAIGTKDSLENFYHIN